MTHARRLAPTLFAALSLLFVLPAQGVGKQIPVEHRPGELLVKFKPNASALEKSKLAEKVSGKKKKEFPRLGLEHWKLPKDADLDSAMKEVGDSGMVEFVEPNYRRYLRVAQKSDACDGQWALTDIQVEGAWTVTTGNPSVRVAVIDTGVDATHPDLANVVAGKDVADGDDDPSPVATDPNWSHGTAVAGAIGGVALNANGVSGVARQVSLVPIRTNFYMDSLLAGFEYAIANKVDIVNASWGGPQFSFAENYGVKALEAAGILLVAAAGNYEIDNDLIADYPSSLPNANVIAVAAGTRSGALASWSQYGASTVDLVAPGEDIRVARPVAMAGDDYDCVSGTSFSTPHVTGMAVLIKSAYPDVGFREIKARIIGSADVLAAGQGLLATDGRANAQAALTIAEQPVLVYAGHRLADPEGNANGVLEPGEGAQLTVTLDNLWTAANHVSVQLVSDDPRLRITQDTVDLGGFPSGQMTAAFRVELAADMSGHGRVPLQLRIDLDGGVVTRRFTLETGMLRSGEASSGIIQTGDQDDMHVWTFHLTSAADRLQFALDGTDGDLDLLVRRGGVPEFDMYCYWSATSDCVNRGTRVSGGSTSKESIEISNALPGIYHVAVVSYDHTADLGYSLRATVIPEGLWSGGGGGGGEGAWFAALALVGLVLRQGRRAAG